MADIEKVVNQAISDFDSIKAKIESYGVEVPYDTDTSRYPDLIGEACESERAIGIEAEKEAGYQAWWDAISTKGARYFWAYGLSYIDFSLVPKGFNPPYQLSGSYMYNMFYCCKNIDILRAEHVDFSKATTLEAVLNGCSVDEIELVDTRKATKLTSFFNNCTVKKIEKLILKDDGSQTFNSGSFNAKKLEEISIEGVIGTNIWFSNVKNLTIDSLMSIINALKDYSGTSNEGTYSVTLSSDSRTLLEEKGNVSPNGNTWIEYIYDKGWTV